MTKTSKLFVTSMLLSLLSLIVLKYWGDIEFNQQKELVEQFRVATKIRKEDPELAIHILSELEKIDSNNFEIFLNLARAHKENKEWSMAEEYFEKTISQRPVMIMEFGFVLSCADVALKQKKLQKAKVFVKQARSLVKTPKDDEDCKVREARLKKLEESRRNAKKDIFKGRIS